MPIRGDHSAAVEALIATAKELRDVTPGDRQIATLNALATDGLDPEVVAQTAFEEAAQERRIAEAETFTIAPPAITPEFPMTEAQWNHECHLFTAEFMARTVAGHYGLDYWDVVGVLRTVSDNLGALIDTPQGWTVLAEQIFITLGGSPGGVLLPVIH